jgi:hypothetical protein
VMIVPAVVIVSAVLVASAVVVVLAVVVMVWLNSGCFEWEVTSASVVGLNLRSSSSSFWIARKGSFIAHRGETLDFERWCDIGSMSLEIKRRCWNHLRWFGMRSFVHSRRFWRTFARQWKKSHVVHIH